MSTRQTSTFANTLNKLLAFNGKILSVLYTPVNDYDHLYTLCIRPMCSLELYFLHVCYLCSPLVGGHACARALLSLDVVDLRQRHLLSTHHLVQLLVQLSYRVVDKRLALKDHA